MVPIIKKSNGRLPRRTRISGKEERIRRHQQLHNSGRNPKTIVTITL